MGMAEKAINRELRSRLFRRDTAFKTLSSFRRTEEISVFDIEMNFSNFLLLPPTPYTSYPPTHRTLPPTISHRRLSAIKRP